MKKFVFFPSMLSENINAERRNVIDRFAACLTPIRVSRRLNDNGGTSDAFQNSITRQSPRTIPSRLLETWPRLLQSIAVSRIGNRIIVLIREETIPTVRLTVLAPPLPDYQSLFTIYRIFLREIVGFEIICVSS